MLYTGGLVGNPGSNAGFHRIVDLVDFPQDQLDGALGHFHGLFEDEVGKFVWVNLSGGVGSTKGRAGVDQIGVYPVQIMG